MTDSIFSKIIRGEIPCHKIYEDSEVFAFLDILPIQPGHTLLVPKQQIEFIWDLPDDLYSHIWAVAKQIAHHQQQVLGCNRIGTLIDGEIVPHAHIHLVPLNGATDMHAKRPASPDHPALTAMTQKLAMQG